MATFKHSPEKALANGAKSHSRTGPASRSPNTPTLPYSNTPPFRPARLRRRWLLPGAGLVLAGVSATLAVPGPVRSQPAAKSRKPNIVFIMADDLGSGDIGPYGQTKIRTPNIDRIGREGVRFTDFYAGSPVCAPSRCTLITGLHSGHSFVRDNREMEFEGQIPLPEGTPTLASLLKKQGYTTGMFGKWGLGYPGSSGEPNRMGWDTFFGYNCQREAHSYYPTHLWRNTEKVPLEGNEGGLTTGKQYSHDLIADEALEFVRKNKDRPFFLYVPFTTPHLSLSVPEDSLAEYRGKFPETPYKGTKGKYGYVPQSHPRAAYAAMITRMDRDIGRLLDVLKQSGLDKNTLVIFTSDNGPAFDVNKPGGPFFNSARSFRAGKGSVYEGGLRVPLVARWPGHIPAGTETNHAAYFPDVLPTLLEVSGSPAHPATDGLSFVPALLGKKGQKEHPVMYWEFPTQGGQQAVRLGRYKGVRRGMASGNAKIEIYDLQTDVSESTDLAPHHPEILAKVSALFKSQHTPSKLFPLPGIDPEAGAKANEGK